MTCLKERLPRHYYLGAFLMPRRDDAIDGAMLLVRVSMRLR